MKRAGEGDVHGTRKASMGELATTGVEDKDMKGMGLTNLDPVWETDG